MDSEKHPAAAAAAEQHAMAAAVGPLPSGAFYGIEMKGCDVASGDLVALRDESRPLAEREPFHCACLCHEPWHARTRAATKEETRRAHPSHAVARAQITVETIMAALARSRHVHVRVKGDGFLRHTTADTGAFGCISSDL